MQHGSVAGSAAGDLGRPGNPIAVEKPALHSKLDQLENVLADIGKISAELQAAGARVMHRPQDQSGGKLADGMGANVPRPVQTVETRIRDLINQAGCLRAELAGVLTHFNQAV